MHKITFAFVTPDFSHLHKLNPLSCKSPMICLKFPHVKTLFRLSAFSEFSWRIIIIAPLSLVVKAIAESPRGPLHVEQVHQLHAANSCSA